MLGNPFQFATPVGPEALVGRAADEARLHELATNGTYVVLEGPRRFGKTSLLKAVVRRWREAGGLAVEVDCSRVLTAPELAQRLEQALDPAGHEGWGEALADLLRALRLKLGPLELGGPGAASQRAPDPLARLHELLELPARAARERSQRSLVCLDEFQDVLAVTGLDGVLRSHIQHHGDDVSYVFCGSEPSLLRSLFADRGRPLYAQAKPLRLGRVDPGALATWVADRFREAGTDADDAAVAVAAAGAGHPQRTVLLAWHLWDGAPEEAERLEPEAAEDAVRGALLDARPEFEAAWRGLAANERRVAVALALGLAPLGAAAQRRTGLATRSAGQRALGALLADGWVEEAPDGSRVLTDPLLARWLATEHAPAPARDR